MIRPIAKEPPDRPSRKHEKLLYFYGAKLVTQAYFFNVEETASPLRRLPPPKAIWPLPALPRLPRSALLGRLAQGMEAATAQHRGKGVGRRPSRPIASGLISMRSLATPRQPARRPRPKLPVHGLPSVRVNLKRNWRSHPRRSPQMLDVDVASPVAHHPSPRSQAITTAGWRVWPAGSGRTGRPN